MPLFVEYKVQQKAANTVIMVCKKLLKNCYSFNAVF